MLVSKKVKYLNIILGVIIIKKSKVIISVILTVIIAILFTGCALRGASAYEIAVRNGFSGTEQEWLESLKGADGATGKDGKDGQNFNVDYTAYELYLEMQQNGEFSGTFEDFVKEYFVGGSASTVETANATVFSSVSLICSFPTSDSILGASYGGSGVFYSVDRTNGNAIIITNYHVVYNADSTTSNKISNNITAYLYGSELSRHAIQCTYIGGSAKNDIALLEVKNSDVIKSSYAQAVTFADSNKISVGETVIAIGSSRGEGLSVTRGIVSVDSEYIDLTDALEELTTFRVLRHDADVNNGNSGGGLFNEKGELIGIVNAKTTTENTDGMNYALPSNVVKAVADKLMTYCYGKTAETFYKPLVGITIQTSTSSAVYNQEENRVEIVETILITSIEQNSKLYNKLQIGDVLSSIDYKGNNYPITRRHMIIDLITQMDVGESFTTNVLRDGVSVSATITITQDMLVQVL